MQGTHQIIVHGKRAGKTHVLCIVWSLYGGNGNIRRDNQKWHCISKECLDRYRLLDCDVKLLMIRAATLLISPLEPFTK